MITLLVTVSRHVVAWDTRVTSPPFPRFNDGSWTGVCEFAAQFGSVRSLALAVIAALLACRSRAEQSSQDSTRFLVVPGQQFGAVAPASSHADLVRVFGAANVHQ